MGDTLSSASDEVAPVPVDKREPLPRPTYLALRLKELAAELQAMVTERQNLNTTLKDHASESSKEVRKMRERRGYLAIRITVLRAEQQSLVAEKESLPPVGKTPGGGGKQGGGGGGKKKAKAAVAAAAA
jgi:hypothetical protein